MSGNDFLDGVGEIFPQHEEYGRTVETNLVGLRDFTPGCVSSSSFFFF